MFLQKDRLHSADATTIAVDFFRRDLWMFLYKAYFVLFDSPPCTFTDCAGCARLCPGLRNLGNWTAELPSLCNVVSSFYQLFGPHFAMTVFMCIYLHYRINKQQDMSFELSSILLTVDLSKHVITA